MHDDPATYQARLCRAITDGKCRCIAGLCAEWSK